MAAGILIPAIAMLQATLWPGWRVFGLAALFGPAFGGAAAYSLARFKRIERSRGELAWVLLSGALAGGFTASLAYSFGYLRSQWTVPGGVMAGAVVLGGLWWYSNT